MKPNKDASTQRTGQNHRLWTILILCFGLLAGLMLSIPAAAVGADDFVITVKTDNSGTSADTEFTIPTTGTGYNYNVDCDNDGTDEATGQTGDYTCSYGAVGTYTVRIKDNAGDGTGFPRIYFNNSGDKAKLLTIAQWGTGKWTTMENAFFGCENMTLTATDAPDLSNVTWLVYTFANASSFNGDIDHWDTSNVTALEGMFYQATSFNQDLNSWDVSKVTHMANIFSGATAFNGNIGNWDTSSVVWGDRVFDNATSFNQDISGWVFPSAYTIASMFRGASSFNQDLSNWDVSGITSLHELFQNATSFDQDISSWDVSSVTSAQNMFNGATLSTANYDALLNSWNAQTLQSGVNFHGGNSTYCAGEAARANMISSDGWTITDGGKYCPPPTQLVIEKQTIPDGSLTPFTFMGVVSTTTILRDGQQATFDVVSGVYTITELAQTGWDLTEITCDDTDSVGVVDAGIAQFNVAEGETVTCVFTNTQKSGQITGWGNSGALSNIPTDFNVIDIAAGNSSSIALLDNGTVFAFGSNPCTPPAGLNNVVAVAAGWTHFLALKADGTVVSWGSINNGNICDDPTATPPSDLTNVVDIAANYLASFAILNDGTVRGWGTSGTYSQVPAGLSDVVALSDGGWGHTIALLANGTVVQFGEQGYVSESPPAGLSDVVDVDATPYGGVALKSDGSIVVWGDGPTPPSGLSNIVDIDAGNYNNFVVAQLGDGTVTTWGNLAQPPADLVDVFKISAGGSFALALAPPLPATVTIEKQTIPDENSASFSFTGVVSGTIGDGQQLVATGLLPGTYTVTETVPSGWNLTSILCDDTDGVGDIANASATITVEAGESIQCTFFNAQEVTPVAKPYLWWVDNRSVMCADTSNGQVVTQFTASDVVSGLSIDEVNHNLYFQIGYWTGLWRTDVDGNTFTNLVDESVDTTDQILFWGGGTAVDPGGGNVFYAGRFIGGSNPVYRANLDGSNAQLMATGGRPRSLEVNPHNRMVYWWDTDAASLYRASMDGDGSDKSVVMNDDAPDFDFHFQEERIYYYDWQNKEIKRVGMDGSGQELLICKSDAGCTNAILNTPAALAVDEINNKLYVLDSGARKIWRTNLDGSGAEEFATNVPGNEFDMILSSAACTIPPATLIIEKQTLPDAYPGLFTFSGTAAGSIADGERITVTNLAPATYTVTETVPAGWTLSSITCDDSNSSGNLAQGSVAAQLEPGETVTCTFTNTKQADGAVAVVTADPTQLASLSFSDSNGSQVQISIPTGAVSETTTLVASEILSPTGAPGTFRFAGVLFNLQAFQNNQPETDFTFQNPIVVTLTYTDNDIAGLDEDSLELHYYDTAISSWKSDGITVVSRNPAANQIVLSIVHLTPFGLFADISHAPIITSDGGGDSASLTVDENQTAVTTVTATDPDINGGALYMQIDQPDGTVIEVRATSVKATLSDGTVVEATGDIGEILPNGTFMAVSNIDGFVLLPGGETGSVYTNGNVQFENVFYDLGDTWTLADGTAVTVKAEAAGGGALYMQIDQPDGTVIEVRPTSVKATLPDSTVVEVTTATPEFLPDGTMILVDDFGGGVFAGYILLPSGDSVTVDTLGGLLLNAAQGNLGDIWNLTDGTVVTVKADSQSLTFSLSGGTDQARFTIGADSGVLTFQNPPDFEQLGDANGDNIYEVTVQVSDGTETDSQMLQVTVRNVNEAPVAVDDSYFALQNTALTESAATGLLINDSDVDSNALFAAVQTNPSHGSLSLQSDGSFSYTPATDFVSTDVFSYTLSDGGLTDIGRVEIKVVRDSTQAIQLSLPTSGWNLFGYPLPGSQAVAQALASIDGQYDRVFGYDPADSDTPWEMYDPTLGAPFDGLLNELVNLEFASGYWIRTSEPVVITFQNGSRSAVIGTGIDSPEMASLPPATLYGYLPASLRGSSIAGQPIQAWIDGNLCGAGKTTPAVDGRNAFGLHIAAADSVTPACGASGRQIDLTVGGATVATVDWDNAGSGFVDFAGLRNHSLFLPLVEQ